MGAATSLAWSVELEGKQRWSARKRINKKNNEMEKRKVTRADELSKSKQQHNGAFGGGGIDESKVVDGAVT